MTPICLCGYYFSVPLACFPIFAVVLMCGFLLAFCSCSYVWLLFLQLFFMCGFLLAFWLLGNGFLGISLVYCLILSVFLDSEVFLVFVSVFIVFVVWYLYLYARCRLCWVNYFFVMHIIDCLFVFHPVCCMKFCFPDCSEFLWQVPYIFERLKTLLTPFL